MKFLSDYTNAAMTAALQKSGAFFAFSTKQFDEQKKEGVQYVAMDAGMICPKENANQVWKDIANVVAEGIRQDIAENGIDAIIERELFNYESFYTGDLEPVTDALKDYGVTYDQIRLKYNELQNKGN